MKLSFINMLKNLLKRWYVILLAVVLGAGVGCVSAFNTTLQTEYIAQVYIDQNFEVKNPAPGVNYPDSVNTLTASLINNSIMAINNTNYLTVICEENDVSVQAIDLKTAISAVKVSENVVQISVKLGSAEASKAVCEGIIENLSVHLNQSIFNNIDPVTGTFLAGTPDSNKIIVSEFMAPTKYVEAGTNKIMKIAIYTVAVACIAVLALVVYDLLKNKVNGAGSVRSIFDLPVDDAKSFSDGAELCLAGTITENEDNKILAFCCGKFEAEELNDGIKKFAVDKKILVIKVDNTLNQTDNKIVKESENLDTLSIANGNLAGVQQLLELINSKNEYVKIIILIKNALNGENAQLYSKLAERVFVVLKNKNDDLWKLQTLIGKLNDNEIKVSRIICV